METVLLPPPARRTLALGMQRWAASCFCAFRDSRAMLLPRVTGAAGGVVSAPSGTLVFGFVPGSAVEEGSAVAVAPGVVVGSGVAVSSGSAWGSTTWFGSIC